MRLNFSKEKSEVRVLFYVFFSFTKCPRTVVSVKSPSRVKYVFWTANLSVTILPFLAVPVVSTVSQLSSVVKLPVPVALRVPLFWLTERHEITTR